MARLLSRGTLEIVVTLEHGVVWVNVIPLTDELHHPCLGVCSERIVSKGEIVAAYYSLLIKIYLS